MASVKKQKERLNACSWHSHFEIFTSSRNAASFMLLVKRHLEFVRQVFTRAWMCAVYF